MREFVITPLVNEDYDNYLLCLTHESLWSYLWKVEEAPEILNQSGILLIDQILVTGNEDNRFFKCMYTGGKLDFSTATKINPSDKYRQFAVEMLQKNYNFIKNSILSSDQRVKVLNGVPF